MMLYERGQALDYLSPCSSSNKKRLDQLLRHPVRWSGTQTTTHSDGTGGDDDEDDGGAEGSAAGKGSEILTMMAMLGGGEWRRRSSSFGSCGPLSVGSLNEPDTPSPVCSPVISRSPRSELCYFSQVSTADGPSFATPIQSSCVMSNDGRKSTSQEGTQMSSWEATDACDQSPQCTRKCPMMRGDEGSSRKPTRSSTKSFREANSTRSAGRHFSCEPREPFRTGNCGDDHGKLPTVSEEEEEGKGSGKNKQRPAVPPPLSSGDDGFYTAGSCGDDSGFDPNSDVESMIEDHLGSMAQAREASFHCFVAQTRSEVEAKLSAWREARTMKLMNKLKEEEDAIGEWERKQITKARMEMREFEMKLEKRRSRAMEVMQRKIMRSQKKAHQMKLKKQAATAQKISNVSKAFDRISSTGKLSWRLVCL